MVSTDISATTVCDPATLSTPYEVLMTGDDKTGFPKHGPFTPEENCRFLTEGGIIYFPKSPFHLAEADLDFLINQKQLESPYHKNIAYRPSQNRVTGVHADSGVDKERLGQILCSYKDQVETCLNSFLAPYKNHMALDYTSFRPIEEDGRKMRTRARNDLLHVDAFPTRPTRGGRILRVFINIHPTKVRVWRTSSNFEQLLNRFKDEVKPFTGKTSLVDAVLPKLVRSLGIKMADRPAYDTWMLAFHHFLKENTEFQATAHKDTWEFTPGSSWMVYTDMVSHSVMSGQHAMEQTFIVAESGLVRPEKAPINLLKKAYGVS